MRRRGGGGVAHPTHGGAGTAQPPNLIGGESQPRHHAAVGDTVEDAEHAQPIPVGGVVVVPHRGGGGGHGGRHCRPHE